MVLVTLSAISGAAIFLLFRIFDKRNIPILPVITLNYFVAFLFGALYSQPWLAGDLSKLWLPSAGVGTLFIGVFYLTALSTQRAGVAASTVASKLSLVITVLFTVLIYNERPTILAWIGIVCALVAVPLSAMGKGAEARNWKLPLLLFFGTASIDISLNAVQRMHLTPATEGVFPTMCFIWAGGIALLFIWRNKMFAAFKDPKVWIGGIVLGVINFFALLFILQALAHSGLPASTVFPLLSIGVILLGTIGSYLIFRDRPSRPQFIGIAVAVIALALLVIK
ncbi:MAG TPA: DMT family transporter [Flavobacteriales bacterium]|nr:DMT family transporter [Flavobacteriales bacterium]